MADEVLKCVDCKIDFIFTEGEQTFYASRTPPLSKPRRCKPCREKRRASNSTKEGTDPHGQSQPSPAVPRPARWTNGSDPEPSRRDGKPGRDRSRRSGSRDDYDGY